MLTQKTINEFKQIYYEEYGKKITNGEAVEMGINLINTIKFLLKPQRLEITEESSHNEN